MWTEKMNKTLLNVGVSEGVYLYQESADVVIYVTMIELDRLDSCYSIVGLFHKERKYNFIT